MADEQIINQSTEELEASIKESRAQQRITQLSEKVELTAKERDEIKSLREQDQKTISELQKENSFNSGFVDMLATHPLAKDHKDTIKEKVLSGYSLEDATLAVLGKAGKLGQIAQSTAQEVAGGSAATAPQSGQKEVKDMTQQERRDILSKELGWR